MFGLFGIFSSPIELFVLFCFLPTIGNVFMNRMQSWMPAHPLWVFWIRDSITGRYTYLDYGSLTEARATYDAMLIASATLSGRP